MWYLIEITVMKDSLKQKKRVLSKGLDAEDAKSNAVNALMPFEWIKTGKPKNVKIDIICQQ